jgi:type I restriction enzyme R subunit
LAWQRLRCQLNSPTIDEVLREAVMDTHEANITMGKQAIESEKVQLGIKDILLGPAQLYEALREKAIELGISRPEN